MLSPGQALFKIRDDGDGFDITALPDPTDSSNLAGESGRGVSLIRAFMDEVWWNASGNVIHMVKHRARAAWA